MADLRQVVGLTQGLAQRSTAEVILFQSLLRSTTQHLHHVVQANLYQNPLVEEVVGGDLVSLDGDPGDFDEDLNSYNSTFEDDLSYKSQADGPAWNEIPDDRKSFLASSEEVVDNLELQLASLDLTERELTIATFLINSIDEHGFLQHYEDISDQLCAYNGYTQSDVDRVYKTLLTKLEPAGILATSPQESLLLQLNRYDSNPQVETAKILVRTCYQELPNRNLSNLARKLNQTNTLGVSNAFQLLEELNPYPLSSSISIGQTRSRKEPDFLVKTITPGEYLEMIRKENGYTFASIESKTGITRDTLKSLEHNLWTLSEEQTAALSRFYKIDSTVLEQAMKKGETFYYAIPNSKHPTIVKSNYSLLDRATTLPSKLQQEAVAFIKKAQKDIDSIQNMLIDRELVLGRIVTYVMNKQRDFLNSHQQKDIEPLLIKEVAAVFHYSESTISSIFAAKFVQLENGDCFRLKEFLDVGRVNEDGLRVSKGRIKSFIQDSIDREPMLTDVGISAKIKAELQLNVSTSYIAKTRESLNIPSEEERRLNAIKPRFKELIDLMVSTEQPLAPYSDKEMMERAKQHGLDLTLRQVVHFRKEWDIPSSTVRRDTYIFNQAKQYISALIRSEDRAKPLSDAELAHQVSSQLNLQIQSAMVAKVRAIENIPSSDKRYLHSIGNEVRSLMEKHQFAGSTVSLAGYTTNLNSTKDLPR